MADSRIVWSELLCADEQRILETLEVLDGIPQYAISVLSSYLRAGCLISNTLLNSLDIEPCFWHQFDDDSEDEFDLSGTFNSDELNELESDPNYELVGDLYAFEAYELHENYQDETIMRASSDSELPMPSHGRASRSLTRSTVSNRVTRLARSHTPRQTTMPPPPAPKKGKAPLRGTSFKKTANPVDPTKPLPINLTDVSSSLENYNPPTKLNKHPPPCPTPEINPLVNDYQNVATAENIQTSQDMSLVNDCQYVATAEKNQNPQTMSLVNDCQNVATSNVQTPQDMYLVDDCQNVATAENVQTLPTMLNKHPSTIPQRSTTLHTPISSPDVNPALSFETQPTSPPIQTQRVTSRAPSQQPILGGEANTATTAIFRALDRIPAIVKNELDDKLPHLIEDLTGHLDDQVADQVRSISSQTKTLVSNMKTSVRNDLSNSISRLVNAHIDGCKTNLRAIENSQRNLQNMVTKYSHDQDAFRQNHPIILDRLKVDLTADLTSRFLEISNSQALQFQAKFDAIRANFDAKCEQLQSQINSMSNPPLTIQPPLPVSLSQVVHSVPSSSNAPSVTPAPSQAASAAPQPPPAVASAPTTLADKLADLVNHKDRDDPPLFDGRESFSHFLSTFEDFVSDWNIPEDKWKHLLTKSLRKGFESEAGKSNHKLEIFLISTTMRHLTYEGLVAAALKHFENENPNTYYNMLVTASQNPTESLEQWYNRVYSCYKDIIKFETTKGNDTERERIRLLAGSTFVSKLHDTGLRALLSSGENKGKTLEALYYKALECQKALNQDRAAMNRPLASVALSQVVPPPTSLEQPSPQPRSSGMTQQPVAVVAPNDQETGRKTDQLEASVYQVAPTHVPASKSQPASDNNNLISELKNLLTTLLPSGNANPSQNHQATSNHRDQRYNYQSYDHYGHGTAYDQYYRYPYYYDDYYYNQSNYDNHYRDNSNRNRSGNRSGSRSSRGYNRNGGARNSLNQ